MVRTRFKSTQDYVTFWKPAFSLIENNESGTVRGMLSRAVQSIQWKLFREPKDWQGPGADQPVSGGLVARAHYIAKWLVIIKLEDDPTRKPVSLSNLRDGMGITISFDGSDEISFEYTAFVNKEAVVDASYINNLLILELITQQRVPGFVSVNADTKYSLRPEDTVNSKFWRRAHKSLDRFESQMQTFTNHGKGLDLFFLTTTHPCTHRHSVRDIPSAELAPLAGLDNDQRNAAIKSLSNIVSVIQGPAGSGKSMVSGCLVHSLHIRGEGKILYLGPTNASMDAATSAHQKQFPSHMKLQRVYIPERETHPSNRCNHMSFHQRKLELSSADSFRKLEDAKETPLLKGTSFG